MRWTQHLPEFDALKKVPGTEPTGERLEDYEDYEDYVEHPRFGKAPRFTGIDPDPDSPEVSLGWRIEREVRQFRSWERTRTKGASDGTGTASIRVVNGVVVLGTAVEADLARQTRADVPVTHYYDLIGICSDCNRRFLFFAEEQKHWYEDLGFYLDAMAVRCTDCRKRLQSFALARKRFEQLLSLPSMSVEETLEMVDCCLTLIEAEEFSIRQCDRVRMLLKHIPEERQSEETFRDLTARLHAVERRAKGEQNAAPTSGPVTASGNSASDEDSSCP